MSFEDLEDQPHRSTLFCCWPVRKTEVAPKKSVGGAICFAGGALSVTEDASVAFLVKQGKSGGSCGVDKSMGDFDVVSVRGSSDSSNKAAAAPVVG